MANKRTYAQYCGIARALEVVGERWSLLIIRDLLVGPRRYSDLRDGLPRIATNVLAARLRELEESGIIQRRALPLPAGSVVYELTEAGRQLEPVLIGLGRWGAKRLGEPADDEVVTADSMIMAMRTTFRRGTAHGLSASYDLRMGPIVLHLRIVEGELHAGEGPTASPDLIIEAGPSIRKLMSHEITAAEAVTLGIVTIHGPFRLLERFVEVFRI
ncbi:MAG: helix-turn-helix domain-containing protein [Longimicrobiales bacterium]